MKTGNLQCLNKKCNFVSLPNKILWTCSVCQEDFKSDAIPYNPLDLQVAKINIKHTLLLKQRAHPNKMPCCRLNVYFTDFYHKKSCLGVLYQGELNGNMVVVCEKCRAINFYERFIWTCPKCYKKFRDVKKQKTTSSEVNKSEEKEKKEGKIKKNCLSNSKSIDASHMKEEIKRYFDRTKVGDFNYTSVNKEEVNSFYRDERPHNNRRGMKSFESKKEKEKCLKVTSKKEKIEEKRKKEEKPQSAINSNIHNFFPGISKNL